MIKRSLYDACLCDDFGGDGCDGTATFGTNAASETTLGYGEGWCATTVDCRVNSDDYLG